MWSYDENSFKEKMEMKMSDLFWKNDVQHQKVESAYFKVFTWIAAATEIKGQKAQKTSSNFDGTKRDPKSKRMPKE